MRPRFDQVEQIGEEITRQSLEALAEAITTLPNDRTSNAEYAVVVFNPTRGPRTGQVAVVLEGLGDQGEIELVTGDGEVLPFQRIGLGSTELMRMVMKPNELRESFGMIRDGVVMGWKVRDLQVRRENNAAIIEMSLVEKGGVNFAAWERGRRAVEAAMGDPDLGIFTVHARTAEVNQITFCAGDVPAYGYRTFWIRGKKAKETEPAHLNSLTRMLLPVVNRLADSQLGKKVIERLAPGVANRPPYCIENEYLRVEAQIDGTIDVLDKQSGVIYRGQNRLVDGGDQGDEYNYSPPGRDRVITARRRGIRVEKGAVQNSLELRLELAIPEELAPNRKTRVGKMVLMPVTSRVTLIQGVPRVEIHTEVTNLARDHRLRVHFPAPYAADEAQHDGHFEVTRRPVGIPAYDTQWVEQPRPETCQRAFTAIDNGETGLLVANRGLPEVEVLKRADGNAEVAVTLLRCVGWLSRDDFPERKGHAGPGYDTPGAQMPGTWSFDYAFVPYQREKILAAYHQAYAFEAPMRGVCTDLHEGILTGTDSFLHVEPESFILSAVMAGEDRQGWLARGYNLSDEPVVVTLRTIQPVQRAERISLIMDIQEPLIVLDHHTVRIQAKGHEIVTVRFRER
jgi:alpha-mannosidase